MRYTRRELLCSFLGFGLPGALGVLSCGVTGPRSTAPVKARRIGYLAFGPAAPDAAQYYAIFRERLQELGYTDGQNLAIHHRSSSPADNRFPELVAELTALDVEAIVAAGDPAIAAARQGTTKIPVVMALANGDPVAQGFVDSYAKPGGQVTGVSSYSRELNPKRLEYLHRLVPAAARVGVLRNASALGLERDWQDVQAAAVRLGVEVVPLDVRRAEDFAGALQAARADGVGAVLVLPDILMYRYRADLAAHANMNRLPAIYNARDYVDAGGLVSYGPIVSELYRRVADMVARLLQGVPAADLPVEQPMRFELAFNTRTAEQLGVTIPRELLQEATDLVN